MLRKVREKENQVSFVVPEIKTTKQQKVIRRSNQKAKEEEKEKDQNKEKGNKKIKKNP